MCCGAPPPRPEGARGIWFGWQAPGAKTNPPQLGGCLLWAGTPGAQGTPRVCKKKAQPPPIPLPPGGPDFIRDSLLLERQSDNRIQLSQIESERLLAELVDKELSARKKAGPREDTPKETHG